jgi:hypothetical protein
LHRPPWPHSRWAARYGVPLLVPSLQARPRGRITPLHAIHAFFAGTSGLSSRRYGFGFRWGHHVLLLPLPVLSSRVRNGHAESQTRAYDRDRASLPRAGRARRAVPLTHGPPCFTTRAARRRPLDRDLSISAEDAGAPNIKEPALRGRCQRRGRVWPSAWAAIGSEGLPLAGGEIHDAPFAGICQRLTVLLAGIG